MSFEEDRRGARAERVGGNDRARNEHKNRQRGITLARDVDFGAPIDDDDMSDT
jgi:hypothetical protein